MGNPRGESTEGGELGGVAHERLDGLDRLEILEQHDRAHHLARILHREGGDEALAPALSDGHGQGRVVNAASALGGFVEEEDPHLAAQEDDPVLELVDHVLHLGLLGERGEAVGVHLPTEPLELGGQLLELVAAASIRLGGELAPADPIDLAREGAHRAQREAGEDHRGDPGQWQRNAGQRQALPERGAQLAPQERGRHAESDAAERRAIERQRQRRLVGPSALVELAESAHGIEGDERGQARIRGRNPPLLVALGVQHDPPRAVGDERVQEMGGVSDARLEQVAKLPVVPQRVERVLRGGGRDRCPALGVDLAGDQLRLPLRLLRHHPGQVRQVDQGRGAHDEEGQERYHHHLLDPDAHSHPTGRIATGPRRPCRRRRPRSGAAYCAAS